MQTIAMIPARYGSSRFPGKPLENICGKPMIWWVFHQVQKVRGISAVCVATDHAEIQEACRAQGIPVQMTGEHATSTERIYEAAKRMPADVYICVNGDEPLIEPTLIEQVIPKTCGRFFAANLMTKINNPVEVVDCTNIKVITDTDGNALMMSRSPIPYPKADMQFDYFKHLGVLAYSMEALRFFAETPKGPLEQIEDINELCFIEHGKKLNMIPVEAHSLSVDTKKDLEYVRRIIEEKQKRGVMKF